MKWKKLGLIFCPNNNFNWMVSHASVPFAVHVSEDLFKIYFSSRDINNKSRIGSFEINLNNPNTIMNLSDDPLLKLGNKGTFDEDGVMLSWITENDDEEYLYYIGWNLGHSIPFRNAIGLALNKGMGFQKISDGPIVDRSIYDPSFVASICVLKESIWKMWYLSCIKWEIIDNKPRHFYHIKYAESEDGINWHRKGLVCIDFKSSDEYAISRPSVIKDQDKYKMWYSYRGKSYRIGYAESFDGVHWIRKDDEAGIDVSEQGWDSNMIEYPHVFEHKGKKYMLYNGNEYGKTGIGLAILVE